MSKIKTVKRIVPTSDLNKHCGITLGGSQAKVEAWPKNPDHLPLTLVMSINCSLARLYFLPDTIPNNGIIYIFSTYHPSEYFLDLISTSGSIEDLQFISNGYTQVIHSEDLEAELIKSETYTIPETYTKIVDEHFEVDDFVVCSMITSETPKQLSLEKDIAKNYNVALLIYSSDFPSPYKDIFYLTDANAYLLIPKAQSPTTLKGVFFISPS